jgi:nucleotide-binding universal stress UspA family protein
MALDRRLLVVLNNDDRDADLIRYAARLAQLNAGAARLAQEVEPAPSEPGAFVPPPEAGTNACRAPILTAEGHHIVLSAARAVRFVHVLPARDAGVDTPVRPLRAQRLLVRVRSQLAHETPDIAARCEILEGPVFERVRQAAAEEESDVVVVGEDRSLAARLVREAACSVWMVPGRPPPLRRLLVPVDFSTRSADSLRVATALARLSGAAECLVLHVYFHDCLTPRPEEDQRIRDRLADAWAAFHGNIDCLGVKVTPLFREGASVARVIQRTAAEREADLVVMASRGRTAAGALLLESVAEQTLHAITIPLLVVKHFGARMGVLRVLQERSFWQKNDQRFR